MPDLPSDIISAIQESDCQSIREWCGKPPAKGNLNEFKDTRDEEYNGEDRTVSVKGMTALHHAAYWNKLDVLKILVDNGASINLLDGEGASILHRAIECDSQEDNLELVKYLVEEFGSELLLLKNEKSECMTALHYAAYYDQPEVAEVLLSKSDEISLINVRSVVNGQPHHNALHATFDSHSTSNGRMVKLLINKGCSVTELDTRSSTPLHLMNANTDIKAVKAVVKKLNRLSELKVLNEMNEEKMRRSPVGAACIFGRSDILSVLMDHGGVVHSEDLLGAIYEGNEEVVQVIISQPYQQMRDILMGEHMYSSVNMSTNTNTRNTCTPFKNTPFRELIRRMPALAKDVLDYCVDDPNFNKSDTWMMHYSNEGPSNRKVTFHWELIDDWRVCPRSQTLLPGACGSSLYLTSDHSLKSHPLSIMVNKKHLDLLEHPVVGSLIHHKWKTIGLVGYLVNFLSYTLFLMSLTVFALIVPNPQHRACMVDAAGNATQEHSFSSTCGFSTTHHNFVLAVAILTIIFALLRTCIAIYRILRVRWRYCLTSPVQISEGLTIWCSIIFVSVFYSSCGCPQNWQWQLGVVVVFLAWMNFIVFMSRFPLIGVYVIMFFNFLWTLLKVSVLAVFVLIAFGLVFYMEFHEPGITRSPFSSPGQSIFRSISMMLGEFSYDSLFRLSLSSSSEDIPDIPFPPVSYLMWIVFIILLPILLANMLIGLAVGDVQQVKDEAALQKLTLQVEQILETEDFLHLLPISLKKKWQSFQKTELVLRSKRLTGSEPWNKRLWRNLLFNLWGGRKYDTAEAVDLVLRRGLHTKSVVGKPKTLSDVIEELRNMKQSFDAYLSREE